MQPDSGPAIGETCGAKPDRQCPACGGFDDDALEAIDLDEQHRHYAPNDEGRQAALTAAARRSSAAYTMRLCAGCGLEWADPMQAPGSDWYGLAYSAMDLYPGARWEFDFVLRHCDREQRVFDIGCGSGEFLKLCRQRGLSASGADFAIEPVRSCQEQGLDVQLVDLQGSGRRSGDATVVTAFQVLEHLAEPGQLFDFARSVSSASASLWIAVPSHRRPSRVFRERDYLDQPPHHLTRWSDAAVRSLGQRHGWSLDELVYEPLPVPASLWWIATRTRANHANAAGAVPESTRGARFSRLMRYPAAWIDRHTRYRKMTGFSMLARFRKTEAQSSC